MLKQEKRVTVALLIVFLLSIGSLCFAAAEESGASSDAAQTSSGSSESTATETSQASSASQEPVSSQESSDAQTTSITVTVEPSSSAKPSSAVAATSSRPVISEQEHDPGLAGSATAPGHVTIPSDTTSSEYEIPSDDGKEDFTLPEQKKNMLDIAGALRKWIFLPILLVVASVAAIVFVNRKHFLHPKAPEDSAF